MWGIRADTYRVFISASVVNLLLLHKWWFLCISVISWLCAVWFALAFPVSTVVSFLCAVVFLVLTIFVSPMLVALFIVFPHYIEYRKFRSQSGNFTLNPVGSLNFFMLDARLPLQQLVMLYIDSVECCQRSDLVLPYDKLHGKVLWLISDAYRLENSGSTDDILAFRKELILMTCENRMHLDKERFS